MLRVTRIVAQCARLVHAFSGRGFLMRMLTSSHDSASFGRLHTELQESMTSLAFASALRPLPAGAATSAPDLTDLKRRLSSLAGTCPTFDWSSASSVEGMLANLQATKATELLKLLQGSTNLETRILTGELQALSRRVDKLESQVWAHLFLGCTFAGQGPSEAPKGANLGLRVNLGSKV